MRYELCVTPSALYSAHERTWAKRPGCYGHWGFGIARTTCLAGLSQQVVLRPCQVDHFRDHLGPHPVHARQFKRRVEATPARITPEGFERCNRRRVIPARALSSAVEHTLYMGEVPGSIPGAPTIVH
jgi:hypothetical protein